MAEPWQHMECRLPPRLTAEQKAALLSELEVKKEELEICAQSLRTTEAFKLGDQEMDTDPDGNMMEFQIDLCDAETAYEFMESEAFENNPIGELFDPDELVEKYEAGENVTPLLFRSDQPEFITAD